MIASGIQSNSPGVSQVEDNFGCLPDIGILSGKVPLLQRLSFVVYQPDCYDRLILTKSPYSDL